MLLSLYFSQGIYRIDGGIPEETFYFVSVTFHEEIETDGVGLAFELCVFSTQLMEITSEWTQTQAWFPFSPPSALIDLEAFQATFLSHCSISDKNRLFLEYSNAQQR